MMITQWTITTGNPCDRNCVNGTRSKVQRVKTQAPTNPRSFQKLFELRNHKKP